MTKQNIRIWGRDFSLPIDYDIFDDEKMTDDQKNALADFLKIKNVSGEQDVIKYCLKENPDEIQVPVTNIFTFVMPASIYVCRENGLIALLCDYKYNIEHGIAVVYKDGLVTEVGTQDLVL